MTRFAVFSYVKDRSKNETVPVGVAVWSPEGRWHRTRFLAAGERLNGVDLGRCLSFVELVREKLEHWEATGRLPYAERQLSPSEDAWWLHVRKLLNHEIWLSEPETIPDETPDRSLESSWLVVTGKATLSEPDPEGAAAIRS